MPAMPGASRAVRFATVALIMLAVVTTLPPHARATTGVGSAATHRANVTIYGPRGYADAGDPKLGCATLPVAGHGSVERSLHHGHAYVHLSLNSDQEVISGTASYWSVHAGPHSLVYSRPWRGDADLPYRTTVSVQGITQHVLLGQVIVKVYDPTVHLRGCKKPPSTSDGPAPVSPGRIGPVDATPSPSSITLQWANPVSSADAGTFVTRSGGPTGPSTPTLPDHQLSVPAGATSLTDDNVSPGYTYVYTLYAHRADGVIGPVQRVAVPALRPGEYTVKVSVDPALARKVGGWSHVAAKVAHQFDVVNQRFNDPDNHLALHYNFHVNALSEFKGSCREALAQPHPKSTFLLAEVDKCPKAVFGARTDAAFFLNEQAVLDAHHVGTLKEKAFASDEGEVLTHEFGHSRGAVDEYNIIAPKGRNSITNTSYFPPTSIMNDQFLTHLFDPYSQHVINAQGNALRFHETEAVAARILPSHVQVRVLLDGQPLTAAATVRLWPVGWGEREVSSEPSVVKVTDAQGVADLGNVFGRTTELSPPWDITTPLLLATVVHQGHLASGWLSIIDATNAVYGQPDQTYVLTLNVSSGAQPPPTTPSSR